MEYIHETEYTCSSHIKFQIDGDIITKIEFVGGCDGNLKAITKLVDGWTVENIIEKCSGITCGRRPTSCADQLSLAVKAAYEEALH